MQDKNELVTFLLEYSKKHDMRSMLAYACSEVVQKKFNPDLMQAALAVILTHSKVAREIGIVVPPLAYTAIFRVLSEETPIIVDPGTLKGPEVLSYFREDYDLNQHHYHWHHVYPYSGISDEKTTKFKRTIFRQGELFLYMHSQMVARYNAELLAWDMDLVHPFDVHPFDYDESPLQEYIPPVTLRPEYTSRTPAGQGWHENHDEGSPPSKSTMRQVER